MKSSWAEVTPGNRFQSLTALLNKQNGYCSKKWHFRAQLDGNLAKCCLRISRPSPGVHCFIHSLYQPSLFPGGTLTGIATRVKKDLRPGIDNTRRVVNSSHQKTSLKWAHLDGWWQDSDSNPGCLCFLMLCYPAAHWHPCSAGAADMSSGDVSCLVGKW